MPVIVDSYSESNQSDSNLISYNSDTYVGQTFIGNGQSLNSAKFNITKQGSGTGNVYARVIAMTGTYGINGVPTGSVLAISDAVNIATISTAPTMTLVNFNFSGINKIILSNGSYYCIEAFYNEGSFGNGLYVGIDISSPSHSGNYYNNSGADNTKDTCFYVYSDDIGVTTKTITGKSQIRNFTPKTLLGKAQISSGSSTWYNSSWLYRKKISIDYTKVNATLSNFPVYIDLSTLGSDFFTNVKSDGSDIRVTTGDMVTEVPREVVFITPGSSIGELHFKAPNVSNTVNTDFYIYYGNSSATEPAIDSTYGAENVWTKYEAVYHFQNSLLDSTTNDHDLTNIGSIDTDSGKIGKGRNINNNALSAVFDFSGTKKLSFSRWFNQVNLTGTQVHYELSTNFNSGNGTLLTYTDGSTYYVGHHGAAGYNIAVATMPTVGNYKYLVDVRDKSAAAINEVIPYIDGQVISYSKSTYNSETTESFANTTLYLNARAGNSIYGNGNLDEFRIVKDILPSTWISTEYNNQNDPGTFYSVSSQEVSNVTTPKILLGIAKIGLLTLKTLSGKSRITITTLRTLLGKSRITVIGLKTFLGKSRITIVTLKTLLGKSRVQIISSNILQGKSRLALITSKLLQGLSRITKSSQSNILGKSRVGLITLTNLVGKSSILNTSVQAISGMGDIFKSNIKTLLGKSAVLKSASQTILGNSSILETTIKTIQGKGDILTNTVSNLSGISRIQNTALQTIIGIFRITISNSKTLLGKSRITIVSINFLQGLSRVTGTTIVNILGKSNIWLITSKLVQGVSRIRIFTANDILGKAKLNITNFQSLIGQSRITGYVNQIINGLSKIKTTSDQLITGKSNLNFSTFKTIIGQTRITAINKQTIRGKASIMSNVLPKQNQIIIVDDKLAILLAGNYYTLLE